MAETPHFPDGFAGMAAWVFDLDNTLYPRTSNIWAQIDRLITDYVMAVSGLERGPARALQKALFRDHGTTLAGLMARYGVDPEHYLAAVHRINYTAIAPDPALIAAIAALPGRKLVYTNSVAGHAERVLARLGATGTFEAVFDIRAAGYRPKPAAEALQTLVAAHGLEAEATAMFDDLAKNLEAPHAAGMTTVQVVPAGELPEGAAEAWELEGGAEAAHVHHVTDDLAGFLGRLR